jgi:hypothetical protein
MSDVKLHIPNAHPEHTSLNDKLQSRKPQTATDEMISENSHIFQQATANKTAVSHESVKVTTTDEDSCLLSCSTM